MLIVRSFFKILNDFENGFNNAEQLQLYKVLEIFLIIVVCVDELHSN
jgi:hypothetical protein